MTLSTHHHHRGDAADDLTEPQMDLVHLYKQYCAEEGCRANSAFLDELERQRHRTAKLHLSLRRNYLGPKGLRPVMRLMEYCQTLTSVDLEGNGVTNEAVDELSAVLEKHLGMQSIILRDNPITVAGGKRLLQLVERNHRITTLDLTGTDVFLALQERIHVVAAENARRTDPKLVEQAQHNTTQLPDAATKAYGGLLPPIRLKKAVIEPICCSKDAAHGEAAESPKTHRHAQPAAITAPQPRPPVPALASNQARMSAAQLSIIRKRFAERARIANEVNRSAANKAAYEVRSELQALEANSKSSAPTEEVLMPIAPPSPSSSSTTTAAGESEVEGDDVVGGGGEVQQQQQQQQQAACTDGSLTVAEVAADAAGVALAQPVVSLPSCTTNTNNNNNDGVLVVGGGGSLPLAEREAATQELTDLLDPARMMLLSSAEQFEVLFEQGCREYAHRHLDAAYLAWNEAMSIAVRQKNREWIAAISSNLQRLSYELLVQEGAQHLEAGRLEDADAAFVLALDVATKAHNAAWEAEMYQARRNVQNAVFHRCHEGALLVFDRLQRVEEVAITEDDYFVIPGTELMIAHTAPFVSEWARILLLQEAIGMWSEAARVYRRIGGTAEAVLKEIVDESLNTVAAYLVQHFFDHDEPTSLSWQRTSHYHHYERIMLSELWESLVAFIYQHLHHKLLGSVAAMQLGNLYLSTYQLPLAARQFESVVAYGRELKDLLVEATGLCFSAILNWQRANYSTADAQFADAVRKFDVLQREMPSPTNNNGNGNNNSNNNNAITAHGEDGSTEPSGQMQVRRAVPADYLDVMRHASIKHRVFIMVATYRYREALEMLEHGLTRKHRDILYEKMEANFSTSPTLEQIVSIACELQSPLVYYLPRTRFVWSVDENIYVEEESILTWVVPQGPSHMRFVEVNVSKDFATTTHELLTTVRRGLLLDPLHTLGVESNIITTLHEHAWMKPLRTLYAIFIDPIIDFIMAQDLDFAEKKGVVTLIPADHVWLVPFNALIKRDTSCVYLVEEVAPQLAFSATHCAFGCVSLERVRTRDLRQNVGVVQGEVGPPTAALFSAPYALDPVRSSAEVEAILHAIAGATAEESRAAKAEAPDATILAGKDGVLRTLEEVRCEVAHARRLHFATGATAGITDGEMSGGLCLAQMNEGLGLLRATEVSHMELFAELVVLSHTNMSMSLMSSTHDDVLGLVRGFLSSGAPCVIAGQWCTPDMKPADLFVRFYEKLFHSRHAQAIEVRQALTNHPYDLGLTTDTLGDDAKHDNLVEQELARHKAVVLAKAMRSLLETEEGFRFNPRAWAGYYCIGYGFC